MKYFIHVLVLGISIHTSATAFAIGGAPRSSLQKASSASANTSKAQIRREIKEFVPIETDGLRIQPLTFEDLAAAEKVLSEKSVQPGYFPPGMVASNEELRDMLSSDIRSSKTLTLKVEDSRTQQLMGLITVQDIRESNLEISYALDPKYWGKGIMPTALRAVFPILLQDAWEKKGIKATTNIVNPQSKRVLEKLGFKELGMNKEADGYDYILTKVDHAQAITQKMEKLTLSQDAATSSNTGVTTQTSSSSAK